MQNNTKTSTLKFIFSLILIISSTISSFVIIIYILSILFENDQYIQQKQMLIAECDAKNGILVRDAYHRPVCVDKSQIIQMK